MPLLHFYHQLDATMMVMRRMPSPPPPPPPAPPPPTTTTALEATAGAAYRSHAPDSRHVRTPIRSDHSNTDRMGGLFHRDDALALLVAAVELNDNGGAVLSVAD
ncbi:uncharacterized protein Tco025E_02753 [Trypanosoma conorhini]|uniref:Uncharacterized protein n=1 Tax=Trypanosoma conorhini TaxID=83891 RepID=A0A3R7LZS4_9TRYP|nr:uncharacterized protein Tco025E_02753 [Trypanosoma conorhini]RNF23780.1 hypothetical protein Tco025E_02753 [Trypanosoma conorhini]